MSDENVLPDAGSSDDFDFDSAYSEIDEGLVFESSEEEEESTIETKEPSQVEDQVSTEPAQEEAAPVTTTAPRTWRKDAQAAWEALPQVVKDEVEKREADMFRGIESYKTAAQVGQSFSQLIEPYMPLLQMHGANPYDHVNGLLQAHRILSMGTPQEKSSLFGQMARDFGIDLIDLAASYDDPAPIDPTVKSLQDQIRQLQSAQQMEYQQRQQYAQQQQQAQQMEVTSLVEKFASDPKHPYFDEVADTMTQLLTGGVASSLDDAYDKAVLLHPTVRVKEQQRQATLAKQQQTEQAAKAASAAKANLRSNAKGVSAAAPLGSIEDTMAQTLAEIRARG